MNIVYIIAKWVIFIEFILIVMTVLMTFILKLVIFKRDKKNTKITNEVAAYIGKSIATNNVSFDNFNDNWRKLNILLPIIRKLESEVDEKWEKMRISFFQSIILPLARIAATSDDWTLRYYAAKSFSLYFEANDEQYILQLINDKIPLIRYNAIIPGILSGSGRVINSIITLMSEEPWLTQFIYLREFYNASGTSRIYIEARLKESNNLKVRYVCYKLLLNYPPLGFSWDYRTDLDSSDLQLKIVTLIYITYVNGKNAIPLLITLLKDADWHIRVASLICLKNLKADEAIPEISRHLEDSNQWVKLASMETLYELGKHGMEVLASKNITYEPIPYDIENHIMKI